MIYHSLLFLPEIIKNYTAKKLDLLLYSDGNRLNVQMNSLPLFMKIVLPVAKSQECHTQELTQIFLFTCRLIISCNLMKCYLFFSMIFNLQTGTLTVVGLHGKETPAVPLRLLVAKAIRIQGSYVGSMQQTKELIKLVTNGKVIVIPYLV